MKSSRQFLVFVTAIAVVVSVGSCRVACAEGMRGVFHRPTDVATVFRAQSPEAGGVPVPPGVNGSAAPADGAIISSDPATSGYMMDPVYQDGTTWNAFSPPVLPDPFLGQPGYGAPATPYSPYSPYGATQPGMPGAPGGAPGAYSYGANSAQPYRFGWSNRIDVSYLPDSSVSAAPGGATGDMEIFGVDYDLAFSSPYVPGWIVNWTNQFSYRNWNGPSGSVGIPSDVFRFGIDLEFETPQSGPFSISLGVTPSINTDFESDVWNEGFMLDGRGIMFFQLDQYWTLGLGAMYWDRVDDIVMPYAGLIYRDDYWEWQLMWPEARISLFLGNEAYWSKWLYVRGEYHVEAYGVESRFLATSRDDRVQLEDYRILIGMKMDSGWSSWFFEGGWVFARDVRFDSPTPGYDIGTGFIGQIGLRY